MTAPAAGGGPLRIARWVAVVVAVQAAALLGLEFYKAVAVRAEAPALERRTGELRREIAELSAALDRVGSDGDYMEGLARRLGFVRRGETALFFPERRP